MAPGVAAAAARLRFGATSRFAAADLILTRPHHPIPLAPLDELLRLARLLTTLPLTSTTRARPLLPLPPSAGEAVPFRSARSAALRARFQLPPSYLITTSPIFYEAISWPAAGERVRLYTRLPRFALPNSASSFPICRSVIYGAPPSPYPARNCNLCTYRHTENRESSEVATASLFVHPTA